MFIVAGSDFPAAKCGGGGEINDGGGEAGRKRKPPLKWAAVVKALGISLSDPSNHN